MSGEKDTIHLQDLESHVRDEDENSKYKPLPLDKIFLTGKMVPEWVRQDIHVEWQRQEYSFYRFEDAICKNNNDVLCHLFKLAILMGY